jgi:glycosyltransferase involved in cell wall biosynthesis
MPLVTADAWEWRPASGVSRKSISVCVCTYRRPELLRRLLFELSKQETAGRFSYSIVVADNDRQQSARDIVAEFARRDSVTATYCVEVEQNVALARNKALEHARGDYVAFIDDDEFPAADWLVRMLSACEQFEVDGVLGPVRPFFAERPPAWLIKSGLCERPEYRTGRLLNWRETRTGNVLFRRGILRGPAKPFRREFGNGGEDQDFFRRMMREGRRFVWCNEAVVYEEVPPARWRRQYFLKRALHRGQNERLFLDTKSIVKSLLAVPAYAALLPVMGVLGQAALMDCSVRLLDHVGKLLGAVGISVVGGRYFRAHEALGLERRGVEGGARTYRGGERANEN